MLVAALPACSDLALPGGETLGTAELLILPLQAGAPAPAGASFTVSNADMTVRLFSHPDPQLNAYLEISFPAGSLASLNGVTLGPDDEVTVSVTPRSGTYGLTLSPAGLVFTSGFRPTITLFFARYGDFSVADGSATYASRDAYAAALDLWEESGLDRWRVANGSRASGTDEVSAEAQAGGAFVLAAPR